MNDSGKSRPVLIGSKFLPFTVVVVSALLGVLSTRGDAVRAQDSSGADLYAANCAGCHQDGGEGLAGVYPPLAGNPAAEDADHVTSVITEGLSGPIVVLGVPYDSNMPPVAALDPDQVAALTEYVVALAKGEAPAPGPDDGPDDTSVPVTTLAPEPPTMGDADAGHDLFEGTDRLAAGGTSCASCHSAADVGMFGGGGLGPDLTDSYNRLGGEPGLTAWLKNPASPTMRPIFAAQPLTDDEVTDLVAFLGDAPNRDRAADDVDWLPIAGLAGMIVLLAGMAVVRRGGRKTYAQTLAARAAMTRSTR